MNKAIIATLVGGAIIGGGIIYSQSRTENMHSVITLQGTNSAGVEQTLTFNHESCNYTDSTGVAIDGAVSAFQVEQTCMLGLESKLSEEQFTCALELCKNTP